MILSNSCSHSPLSEEGGGLYGIEGMELPVIMSVLPPSDGGETPGDDDPVAKAESTIKSSELYIATYTPTGEMIEKLYDGPNGAASGVSFYDHLTWGPTIAAKLNKQTHTEYNQDFFIAAFAVENGMLEGSSTFNLNAAGGTIGINYPSAGSLWSPSGNVSTNNCRIPMAGCIFISKRWIEENYNKDIYGVAPMELPSIPMVRAMAKIVIEDIGGIISKAECRHRSKANLKPKGISANNLWWIPLESEESTWKVTDLFRPNTPSGNDLITQTVTVTPKENNKIIFYAFESDFKDLGSNGTVDFNPTGTTDTRAMIRLTASNVSLGTKTIHIAPYDDGILGTKTYTELTAGENGYMWSGLLRNHCYTFKVEKPSEGEIKIYVKASEWTRERIDFEF